MSARVEAVFYYLNIEFESAECDDPRFISGRCAAIVIDGERAGVYGEVHPSVLENWGVQMPCAAAEVDLDALLAKAARF